jgi:hypothetical protein
MKKLSIVGIISFVLTIIMFSRCNDDTNKTNAGTKDSTVAAKSYGEFGSQVKWGEHLVTIGGCNDCHTPKKMTPMGPVIDTSLALSGHPAMMPPPDIDRKEVESKGLGVTQTLTSWVGPWGISYAANLTSDSTGIGNWNEDQFMLCLREGKWKGLAGSRTLLPPMPWEFFKSMTDDELKAIFAYLKSTKPIHNVVPEAAPPLSARKM